MEYTYTPKGVCSMKIKFEINDGIVSNVKFTGGCNGNTQGLSKLAEGRKAEEVIAALEGIKCGFKSTSCPDQLAKALKEATVITQYSMETQKNFEKLTETLDISLEKGVPGYDCVIYHNGKCVYRRFAGSSSREKNIPMTGKEFYNIYSCSKLITCVAGLQLYEKGLFDLDDDLCKYMPEFSDMNVRKEDGSVRKAKKKIKIKHLFEMSAGFGYDVECESIKRAKIETDGRCPTRETMKYIAKEPLYFEPGEMFRYSLCHDVLAGFIEVISGKKFGEYVKENIFDPLGMVNSTFSPDDGIFDNIAEQYKYIPKSNTGSCTKEDERKSGYINYGKKIISHCLGTEYESGGAGAVSTVDDYIKLLEALRIGDIVLKAETVDLMATNRFDDSRLKLYWLRENGRGYGYGLGVRCPFDSGSEETDFGWTGAAGACFLVDKVNNITMYYSQHVVDAPNDEVRDSIIKLATEAVLKRDFK